MTLDDIFAEGEMVAFRWSVSGTHLGEWLGMSPTANHVRATGITIFRIAGGRVMESWTSIDLSPAEEELQWLTEGGGGARSGDVSLAERDISPAIWDDLTRNLTWRLRVEEARAGTHRAGTPRRPPDPTSSCPRRPRAPRLELAGGYYKPAREVGGDFYDFLELEDGCLGLVVGDYRQGHAGGFGDGNDPWHA